MPLRIRRGTDAERLTITPLEGELIYTTDTKLVYVGDGTTVGGLDISVIGGSFGGLLGRDLDLNGFNIVGLGDINTIGNQTLSNDLDVGGDADIGGNLDVTGNISVGGTITAQGNIIANGNITLGAGGNDIIVIDGEIDSNIIPGSNFYSIGAPGRPWGTLYVNGIEAGGLVRGDFEGNLRANDSSLVYDSTTNTFTGSFIGNLQGDVVGNLSGSLFADNSSLLVDGINNSFHTSVITIEDDRIVSTSGNLTLGNNNIDTVFDVRTSGTNIFAFYNLVGAGHKHYAYKGSVGSTTAVDPGDILMINVIHGQDGSGTTQAGAFGFFADGTVTPGDVPGKFAVATYTNGNPSFLAFDSNGRLSIGKLSAVEALDVEGNGLFSGSVTAAAFKGSFVADDSSIIVDGISGAVTAPTVTASTFIQFPVYADPTTRNTAIPNPAAGMVVFVTDSTGAGGPPKLQANTDGTTGGWVDL